MLYNASTNVYFPTLLLRVLISVCEFCARANSITAMCSSNVDIDGLAWVSVMGLSGLSWWAYLGFTNVFAWASLMGLDGLQ